MTSKQFPNKHRNDHGPTPFPGELAAAAVDRVLRWHTPLMRRRWTHGGARPGRSTTATAIRRLVLAMARDNPLWEYRRIHGELVGLGHPIAASTVWKILTDAGLHPAPRRSGPTWKHPAAAGASLLRFRSLPASSGADETTVDDQQTRRILKIEKPADLATCPVSAGVPRPSTS